MKEFNRGALDVIKVPQSEQIYVPINFDKGYIQIGKNPEKGDSKLMLNPEMLFLSLNALRAITHTYEKKVKLSLFSQITMESNLRAQDCSSTYGATGISKDEIGAGERSTEEKKQLPVTSSIQVEAGQQSRNIKEQI